MEKKTGCVDKNCKVTWRMREVATLACPIGKLKTDQYDDVTEMGSEETWAGTNKKPRLFTDEDKNQSRT